MKRLEDTQSKATSTANLFSVDDKQSKSLENEVHKMTKRVQTRIRDCERTLKKFISTESESSSEKTVKLNIQRGYAMKLQELTQLFRQKEKSYFAKIENNGEEDLMNADMSFNSSQKEKASQMFIESTSRKQEIEKIAKSVNEIATLFKDLSNLVIEQVFLNTEAREL